MKQKLGLALLLTLSTALSVFADGETTTGNRSILEILYDEFGNIIGYIFG
ncbi:MAG: hypothetical protein AAB336_02015 [Acidobacteriota bacterium]